MSIRSTGAIVGIALAALLCVPASASAQDALSRAKGFYQSAEYEEALSLLDSLKGTTANTEAAAYRVFCLVALGRRDEAKAAVEAIVRLDPMYRPSEAQVSPRLRTFFEDARKPLLPEVVRRSYASAKAAFDQKSWAVALKEFDQVLSLLTEIGGTDPGVSDLRTLATGFRDLANSSIPPPPPPAPAVQPKPEPTPTPAPAEPVVYSIENADVRRPVAIIKNLPEWRPTPVEANQQFGGALELLIGENGKVISVKVIDPVHPRYDQDLLKAAAKWTFQPATKNGVPVRFRYAIAVQLGK